MYLCELHIIQNIERKASKNIVGRAKSDRKARAGSVLNLLFLFIGGFMSNKEERMNRNKSIIEDYKNKINVYKINVIKSYKRYIPAIILLIAIILYENDIKNAAISLPNIIDK